MAAPRSVVLFPYRVGFGDCFLLRFEYARESRHVLLDFGSTAPAARVGNQMRDVARDIAQQCGGKLHAIVATHRHRDHVSGFAGETWSIIRDLEPELVVLPWTEHPEAETDARVAPSGSRGRIGVRSVQHARSLAQMHAVAQAVLDEVGRKAGPLPEGEAGEGEEADLLTAGAEEEEEEPGDEPPALGAPFSRALTRQLQFLGEDNLRNAQALKNLLSVKACDFVSFGSRTRLQRLLPGVEVHVLGPPTLAQTESILEQRSRDPDEFWHLMAMAAERSSRGRRLFPKVKPVDRDGVPPETRWFLRRLDAVRGEQLLEIVRILDEAMNNTSVILLFEACGKKLLFPGDAQLENWQYALSKREARTLLRGVDVYKVGHHGSLNATPKTLWSGFTKKGGARKKGRLRTFLSTRPGKHGSPQRRTEVPRSTLVEALDTQSELFSTHRLLSKDELVRPFRIAP